MKTIQDQAASMNPVNTTGPQAGLPFPGHDLPLLKMPLDQKLIWDFNWDYNNPEQWEWVNKLMLDLTEELDEEDRQLLKAQLLKAETAVPKLDIHLEVTKFFSKEFGEHILIHGRVSSLFYTQCVKCLTLMPDQVSEDFKICFLDDALSKNEEYSEIDTLFAHGEEHELYFFHNKKINLFEFLHERLFLNRNDCPVHDEDCKGLCDICGANLNKAPCVHKMLQARGVHLK